MPNDHLLRVEVIAIRPDLDTDYLEGSACTLRVSAEPTSGGGHAGQQELSQSLDTPAIEADARFLAIVRLILANLIASRFAVLFAPPVSASVSWYPELLCRSAADTARALDTYGTLAVAASARDGREVPLIVWAIPTSDESFAFGSLEDLRSAPQDRWRWRKALQAGIVTLTLYADTCTLAFDCDHVDRIGRVLRNALHVSPGVAVTWVA
jgi:hypothetical protein